MGTVSVVELTPLPITMPLFIPLTIKLPAAKRLKEGLFLKWKMALFILNELGDGPDPSGLEPQVLSV
jgi:hypothetical protein